jgi:hypothetical protein
LAHIHFFQSFISNDVAAVSAFFSLFHVTLRKGTAVSMNEQQWFKNHQDRLAFPALLLHSFISFISFDSFFIISFILIGNTSVLVTAVSMNEQQWFKNHQDRLPFKVLFNDKLAALNVLPSK